MDKETIFNNWNFMRWLRLGLGIYIAFQAIETISIFLGVVAAFFIFQAIVNIGCCATNGCALPIKKSGSSRSEEIGTEEIK